jgi:hypothetical protein
MKIYFGNYIVRPKGARQAAPCSNATQPRVSDSAAESNQVASDEWIKYEDVKISVCIFTSLYFLEISEMIEASKIFGGDGETRTLKGCPTRPSTVRVYQFRHIPVKILLAASYHFFFNTKLSSSNSYLPGAGDALVAGLLAGDGVVSAGAAVLVVFAPSCAGLAAGDAPGEACGAGVAAGVSSSTSCSTERWPVMAGNESASATSMNMAAAPIVIFASRDCVPRGPKAVLEMLLEKSAPASALPGCKSTETMSTMQDKIKSM